jgi:AraC-like DNA-binding protein
LRLPHVGASSLADRAGIRRPGAHDVVGATQDTYSGRGQAGATGNSDIALRHYDRGVTTTFQVRTADLPREHRFEAWSEMARKTHVPVLIDTAYAREFLAFHYGMDLGPVQMSRAGYPPIRGRRTAAMVRASDPESVLLLHVTRGVVAVERRGRQVRLERGGLVALDTSSPVTWLNPVPARDMILNLPASLIGVRRAQVETILGVPMRSTGGIGGLLRYVLRDLLRHGTSYEPAVVTRLASVATDLLAIVAQSGVGSRPSASDTDRIRQLQIYSYMEEHLTDPALTPDRVAIANGVSVRHLDRLLQADGTSPWAWIRHQRLERCRRDLVDPAHAGRPIAAIGSRWGFGDPAGFNRAFRGQYGLPPGEYRRRHAGGGTD